MHGGNDGTDGAFDVLPHGFRFSHELSLDLIEGFCRIGDVNLVRGEKVKP